MNRTLVTFALPRAVKVTVTDDTLSVDMEDGRTVSVPIGWYPRLAHGMSAERTNVQISGAGFGFHWPDLDEDLGVEGLLLGKHSAESPESFERWLQKRSNCSARPNPRPLPYNGRGARFPPFLVGKGGRGDRSLK